MRGQVIVWRFAGDRGRGEEWGESLFFLGALVCFCGCWFLFICVGFVSFCEVFYLLPLIIVKCYS